jgi:hypothetical protein
MRRTEWIASPVNPFNAPRSLPERIVRDGDSNQRHANGTQAPQGYTAVAGTTERALHPICTPSRTSIDGSVSDVTDREVASWTSH